MLDTNKMPAHVYDALVKRGHKKEMIQSMTPEEAFEEYCEWHGLIHWGNNLWTSLDGLRTCNNLNITGEDLRKLLTKAELTQLNEWRYSFSETETYPDMDNDIRLRDKLYNIFRNALKLQESKEPYNAIIDYTCSLDLEQ